MKFGIFVDPNLELTLSELLGGKFDGFAANLQSGMASIAKSAGDQIRKIASQKLKSQKSTYLNALSVQQLDDGSWSIILDASAKDLEEGYDSFDMKKGLLKLGQALTQDDNIHISKKGYRYRSIPFNQKMDKRTDAPAEDRFYDRQVELTTRAENRAPNEIPVGRTTTGNMLSDLKRLINSSKLKDTTLDSKGMPVIGKVASITQNQNGSFNVKGYNNANLQRTQFKLKNNQIDKNVLGVIKYQKETEESIKATYMTFRTVSEKPDGKWVHPGFSGVKAFESIQTWTDQQLNKLIDDLIK